MTTAPWLGIDVGSTTVKVVAVDTSILAHRYVRSAGQPRRVLLTALDEVAAELGTDVVAGFGLTGSGSGPIADLLGVRHVNEVVAQTRAVGVFHRDARTVVEIGGQDSKFLTVCWDPATDQMRLVDFAMNTLCAAGTGSFLDQQAERLGIAIDGEFAEIALRSRTPARVAGRCTVFARSDIIHLQQAGTPLPDILAGLCEALARNFRGVVARGKEFRPPVLFQGGVARNAAVVRAFETVLGLRPGDLVVPAEHCFMAALGTAWLRRDASPPQKLVLRDAFAPLASAVRSGRADTRRLARLSAPTCPAQRAATSDVAGRVDAWIGVDVGSMSTNVVVLDDAGRVVARRYLPTAGRPLEAVRDGLRQVGDEVGARVRVRGVGVTGSGRQLTADFVGADVIRNEITPQARAAREIDPAVDTIFEIGGQDSKYIRLEHGTIVDFAMNNACAAGTGAFLEEQAQRLNLRVDGELGELACAAPAPVALGERCTVFMESDLVHHQQRGARVDDLAAGLAHAIVENYLNRVVAGRPIGQRVFFQGGVAWNPAVAAAFEAAIGRPVTVPPHHDVTGAIGAALLAREEMAERAGATRFHGFDLSARTYRAKAFVCRACANLCEVNRVVLGADRPVFYNARCDRFEGPVTSENDARPDLFAERDALLLGSWSPPGPKNGRVRVAMPRVLTHFDVFPYWRALVQELGAELVLSAPTSPATVRLSQERAVAEACFPVKLAYGHVAELQKSDADVLLLPAIVDRENLPPGQVRNQYCPFIPAAPYLLRVNLGLDAAGPRPVVFPLHMLSRRAYRRDLRPLAAAFGVSGRRVAQAAEAGEQAQRAFYAAIRARGREVLDGLRPGQRAAVVVGRPYNTCDAGACQDLPRKLRRLGVLAVPNDFLPVQELPLPPRYEDMYWRCGQDILAAATMVRDDPRLQAIYLTNFNCGPDSFLVSFFRKVMNGKPFLELEMDDHTADAGVVTRCEAFFDSSECRRRSCPV